MSAAEIIAALRAAEINVSVTERGTLKLLPSPPPDLLDAVRAAKAEIVALLSRPYIAGPCAEAALCDPDGFGWQLPGGLIPILDAAGRFCGWMLDPAWKPERLVAASPKPEVVHDPVQFTQDVPRADTPTRPR